MTRHDGRWRGQPTRNLEISQVLWNWEKLEFFDKNDPATLETQDLKII